jgi:hypothetical protein
MTRHRAPIILLAAQHNVPAVYQVSVSVKDGGLLSYGTDPMTSFVAQHPTWIAFSVAQSQRSFPFNFRSNSRWL